MYAFIVRAFHGRDTRMNTPHVAKKKSLRNWSSIKSTLIPAVVEVMLELGQITILEATRMTHTVETTNPRGYLANVTTESQEFRLQLAAKLLVKRGATDSCSVTGGQSVTTDRTLASGTTGTTSSSPTVGLRSGTGMSSHQFPTSRKTHSSLNAPQAGKVMVTALGLRESHLVNPVSVFMHHVLRLAGAVVGGAPSIMPRAPGGAPLEKSSLGSRETILSSTPT